MWQVSWRVGELARNLTLLSETGYAEGEVCHRLVTPTFPQQEKQVT